jgi:hypothetical protein
MIIQLKICFGDSLNIIIHDVFPEHSTIAVFINYYNLPYLLIGHVYNEVYLLIIIPYLLIPCRNRISWNFKKNVITSQNDFRQGWPLI